jgi:membrane protein required for colicin V production
MTIPLIGTLNTLDLLLLGALIFFVGLGAWKGLVKALFQTASWIAGMAGGYYAYAHLGSLLRANIAHIPVFGLNVFAAFVGFIACFLLVRILGSILNKFISGSALSGFNRWGGALVGLLKALILASVLLFILQILPLQGSLQHTRDSSLCYHLWKALALPGLPKDLTGISTLPIQ